LEAQLQNKGDFGEKQEHTSPKASKDTNRRYQGVSSDDEESEEEKK